MLSSNALQKFREFILSSISHGKYQIGTTSYAIPIHKTEISNEVVYVYLLIDHNVAGTVNKFELYSYDNQVFAEKPDSLIKDNTQGILARFAFTIEEV